MSEQSVTKMKAILTENGYRITDARTILFNIFLYTEPLSLKDIITRADKRIDRVSIYRNIELFETLHIIQRINIGWKYKLELSDTFVGHHHHMTCLMCGKIIDIKDESLMKNFIDDITSRMSFTAKKHHFEIEGYCHDCQR